MNQLETAGALPAAWLPFADIASTEPQLSAQACPDDAPTGEPAADPETADSILYVSPPPMPWPRVFPGL